MVTIDTGSGQICRLPYSEKHMRVSPRGIQTQSDLKPSRELKLAEVNSHVV